VNVIVYGASGMIGQGVLRECFLDPDVSRVLAIGRSASGQSHPKLTERVLPDPGDLVALEPELREFDACFFSAGPSAVGMTEADYSRVTHDFTLAVAGALARVNPKLTFIYVSGQGTDSTERGRSMWARVKGRTENDLLKLPLQAYMFRPGLIIPLHGIRSKTTWYNTFYSLTRPLNSAMLRFFPMGVTTTERLGRAMLSIGKTGFERRIVTSTDINTRGGNGRER
jgi:uncharacterized protein YbjT (DUF2867 family)